MNTLAGGDFWELSHKHTIPAGLVSDPPNYTRCVDRLGAVSAAAGQKHTTAELLRKCRQLYQALKQQAVSYLVGAQWRIALDAEVGITASDKEVDELYRQTRREEFPSDADQARYLAERRRTLADELFVLKLDLLSQKTIAKLEAGGRPLLAKFNAAGRRWEGKTSCHPGYVVLHCKGFVAEPQPSASLPPASILMEQVATLTGVECINRAACGRSAG
jgi:hypothetical protein